MENLLSVSQPEKYNYVDQMRDLVLKIAADMDCTIFLFGSRASGTYRRGSDIDIGFSGLSETEFIKVRDLVLTELEESLIPHHVDMVNFATAPPHFRQVAMKKVLIWKQSSNVNSVT